LTEPGRVELASERDVVVARLIGEIDLSNANRLEHEISRALSNQSRTLVLDLTECGYLDSAGIRLIFGLSERLSRRGQDLRLVVPEGAAIERVLGLTNIAEVAALNRGVEQALARQRAAPRQTGAFPRLRERVSAPRGPAKTSSHLVGQHLLRARQRPGADVPGDRRAGSFVPSRP
jgi:anti-anti-sigma factor